MVLEIGTYPSDPGVNPTHYKVKLTQSYNFLAKL